MLRNIKVARLIQQDCHNAYLTSVAREAEVSKIAARVLLDDCPEFSDHALDRMNEDQISGQDVIDAIKNPAYSEDQDHGTTLIEGENGVTVVVNEDGGVVTVWPTGNLD
ncbi:MAG: DUF4258 domain-containing protein [Pseudomonadota bacterium]